MKPAHARLSAASARQPCSVNTFDPSNGPTTCPRNSCVIRVHFSDLAVSIRGWRMTTHREDEARVEARPRARVEPAHGGRERHLLRLPEEVEPDRHDDDDGGVQADRRGLEREREEQHRQRERRRGPGHERVDRAPDDRRHRDPDDAHQAEEPDHDAVGWPSRAGLSICICTLVDRGAENATHVE